MLKSLLKKFEEKKNDLKYSFANFKKNKHDKNYRKKLYRSFREFLIYTLIYGSVIIVLFVLFYIVFWIFSNGISGISVDFLTNTSVESVQKVTFKEGESYDFEYSYVEPEGDTHNDDPYYELNEVKNVNVPNAIDDEIKLSNGTHVEEIDDVKLEELSSEEANAALDELKNPTTDHEVQVLVPGNGVKELVLTTLYLVLWSLIFALPIGLFSAIYLVEYDVNPKLNRIIHFAIDSLAGIPSIIFGLFGSLFFGITLGLGQSLLAGILTVSIMLLPIIIKSIEETLLSVPQSYREASYGLGATKSQTLFKVIIPSSLPGILVAIILAMGRVIGESAIFIFVVGTAVAMPSMLGKGASLTVQIYSTSRESLDIEYAASLAIVVFVMILVLNLTAKLISNKLGGKK